MGLSELSDVLWRERRLLELLQFKLEEAQLVLRAGRTRWLAHANREVEHVLDEITRAEMVRTVELAAAAPELGLAPDATLAAVSAAAPRPWDKVFRAHLDALHAVTREVLALAEGNRGLLQARAAGARRAVDAMERRLAG